MGVNSGMKPAARVAAMLLLIALFPIIIVLANASFIAYSQDFYENEVAALGSAQRYAEAPELAKEIADFYTKGAPLPKDKLNEREIAHLADVKRVFFLMTLLLYFCIILYSALVFALYKTSRNFKTFTSCFKKCLLGGSILLIVLLGLSPIVFTSFHDYFTRLHYIFFDEGTWNFPQESNLIRTFPEQFFTDAALGIAINSFLLGAGILALSFLSVKFKSSR